MNVWDAFACIILFGFVAVFVGHILIDAFFKRKEEIISQLTQKGDF